MPHETPKRNKIVVGTIVRCAIKCWLWALIIERKRIPYKTPKRNKAGITSNSWLLLNLRSCTWRSDINLWPYSLRTFERWAVKYKLWALTIKCETTISKLWLQWNPRNCSWWRNMSVSSCCPITCLRAAKWIQCLFLFPLVLGKL